MKCLDSETGNDNNHDYTDAEVGEEHEIRDRRIEYILSVIGYVNGYSSLWRFPYMCIRNGGGTFIIAHCV